MVWSSSMLPFGLTKRFSNKSLINKHHLHLMSILWGIICLQTKLSLQLTFFYKWLVPKMALLAYRTLTKHLLVFWLIKYRIVFIPFLILHYSLLNTAKSSSARNCLICARHAFEILLAVVTFPKGICYRISVTLGAWFCALWIEIMCVKSEVW